VTVATLERLEGLTALQELDLGYTQQIPASEVDRLRQYSEQNWLPAIGRLYHSNQRGAREN
jgi:hypothetical protein